MPGFITHYLYGMKAYHDWGSGNLKSMLHRHHAAYCLGLQGPDIYFFYLPSLIGDGSKNIGSLMHATNVHYFFKRYLDEMELLLGAAPDRDSLPSFCIYHFETAVSYLAGFLCHYTLDFSVHPYIYSKTGYDLADPQQLNYYANHRAMETRLDTYMLHYVKHKEPSTFQRQSAIPKNRFEESFLTLFLCRCINDVFYPDSSPSIYKKINMTRSHRYIDRLYYRNTKGSRITPKNMRSILSSLRWECHILNDRTGIKKKLVIFLENKTVKYNILSSLMTSDHITDTRDEWNLSHHPWYSPWEPHRKRQESFPELFLKAQNILQDCWSLLESYGSFLEEKRGDGRQYKKRLLDTIGNRSYHSGLSLDIPPESGL